MALRRGPSGGKKNGDRVTSQLHSVRSLLHSAAMNASGTAVISTKGLPTHRRASMRDVRKPLEWIGACPRFSAAFWLSINRWFVIFSVSFQSLSPLVSTVSAKSSTFYVATNGNDDWSGRLEKPAQSGRDGPLATLPAALKAARIASQNSNPSFDQATIFLRGGVYSLAEPIVLRPEDSGRSAVHPLIVAAYRAEKPVLSGGRRITGWKRVEGKSGLWQAAVTEAREGRWYFRQLFIDGQRKQRARSPNSGYLEAAGEYVGVDPIQFKYRNGDITKDWVGSGVELIALHKWIDLRQYIRGLNETNQVVTLSGAVAPHVKESNARYYIENAPDALDQPGEWYLDRKTGELLYWAEPGEDLARAEVIAPVLNSELLRIEGDFTAKKPVQHVVLRGLTFVHTDWSLPETGYLDSQAAVHVRGDVLAEGAVDCVIENCAFVHLGGYALELGRGCQRCQVVANEIYDIGAGGIRVGETAKRTDAFEMNHGQVIENNHLHQLGR